MTPIEILRQAAARRAAMERYAADLQAQDHLAEMTDMVGMLPDRHVWAAHILAKAWRAERDDPCPPAFTEKTTTCRHGTPIEAPVCIACRLMGEAG